jgi:hypothetical protein
MPKTVKVALQVGLQVLAGLAAQRSPAGGLPAVHSAGTMGKSSNSETPSAQAGGPRLSSHKFKSLRCSSPPTAAKRN